MAAANPFMESFFSGIQRHALWIVLTAIAVGTICLNYTVKNLRINTDTANMIDARLPFRQSWEQYRREFSFNIDSLLLVIDASGPEEAERIADEIATALEAMPDRFEQVYRPGGGEFFERNALLYLNLPDLEALAERLIAVQPLLGRLSRDPSVDIFADTLTRALTESDGGFDTELWPVLNELDLVLDAALEERPYRMSWQRLLGPDDAERNVGRSYVHLKPRLDFGDLLAAEPAIAAVRDVVAGLDPMQSDGVRVRITGDAALAYEELLSAMRGAQIAGFLALIMVTGVLVIGLGSVWLVIASLLTLVVGLIATAGFATIAIGHLNLISIAFAVLYIGLGVDYAIHICLRYRELLGRDLPKAIAIRDALKSVGGSLLICTLTTATAFYVFLPTAFSGVAELGLISGTGMFINLILSMILLPAFLGLLPSPKPWHRGRQDGVFARLLDFPRRHFVLIGGGALLLALAASFLLPQVRFDRNTLNLRDPDSESVATIRELMAESETSPMSIDMLVVDPPAWHQERTELLELSVVENITGLSDFIPDIDDEKLFILDELSLTFGPDLVARSAEEVVRVTETMESLEELRAALAQFEDKSEDETGVAATGRTDEVAAKLGQYLQHLRTDADPVLRTRLEQLQNSLLVNLPRSLVRLKRALEPETDGVLPAELKNRWISDSGIERINIQPAEDIDQGDALRRFVETVRSVVPNATGEPVLMLLAGDAVVKAFTQAFSWALVLITGLLLFLLRNVVATLFVITPLILTAALSLASLVLLDAPLNFANVIALPLLFGIGVDNGIHMVQRVRQGHHTEENPLRTSTARAIFFSALTTMCGFGNLLISPHPGTASMGLLLTIGTVLTLFSTLIVLPALLAARPLTPARS